jgi:DNA polymerase V
MKFISAITEPNSTTIPFFDTTVKAGFPSPAEDSLEGELNLNEHLVPHPASTFFIRVEGESMVGAGIFPGDLLIIDRSLQASKNSIILAVINNEFTVKRLISKKNMLYLHAENAEFEDILITGESGFQVWGIVTYVIHQPK